MSDQVRQLEIQHPSTPAQWCWAYRQRDLPARVLGDMVIMPTGRIAAMHMPESLGLPVFSWLRQRMFVGPVLVRPTRDRGERWTFLATRNIRPKLETLSALNATGAGLCAQDTPLTLPLSWRAEPGSSWWVSEPKPGRALPLLSAVICATRTIAVQRKPVL